MKTSQRIGYVDIAKLIAILAVIYDHSQYYVTGFQHSNSFVLSRGFVFSFYLQIFFLAVGLIHRGERAQNESWVTFLKKQFFSIVIPYVSWAAILSGSWNGSFVKGVLWGTQTSLSAGTDSILWFLPALFWAKVIDRLTMQLIHRFIHNESPVVLAAFGLILGGCGALLAADGSNAMIWGIDIALMGAALIFLGRLLKPLLERIRQMPLKGKLSVAAIALVASLILAYANLSYAENAQGIYYLTKAVWMAHGYFGVHWILFLISSAVSGVFIMTVAMLLEPVEILSRLGRNTLGYMLVHGRLYPLAAWVVTPMLGFFPAIVVAVLVSVVNLALCVPTVAFVARFAPALLGIRTGTKSGEEKK